MRTRRGLRGVLVVLMTLLAAVGMSASAGAQVYPPPASGITASSTTFTPGSTISFRVTGFMGGSIVDFTLFSTPVDLGSAEANADGVAVLNAEIPDVAPGKHTVVASGLAPDGSPLSVSVSVTVQGDGETPDGESASGDLPRTGSDKSFPLVRAGAALVVAGGVLVLLARRRRSRSL